VPIVVGAIIPDVLFFAAGTIATLVVRQIFAIAPELVRAMARRLMIRAGYLDRLAMAVAAHAVPAAANAAHGIRIEVRIIVFAAPVFEILGAIVAVLVRRAVVRVLAVIVGETARALLFGHRILKLDRRGRDERLLAVRDVVKVRGLLGLDEVLLRRRRAEVALLERGRCLDIRGRRVAG